MTSVAPLRPRRRRTGVPLYLGLLTADEAADAMFYVALYWVAAHTGSPATAAVIVAAGTIPRIVVMLLGGVIGDRLGVARVASWTLSARAGLMAVFAVVLLVMPTPAAAVLAGLAAVVGLADALHMPAMGGVAGLLAEVGEQSRVQGLVSAVTNGTIVVATAAGGILLGWRPGSVGLVALACLLVAVVALAVLRRRHPEQLEVVADEDDDAGAQPLLAMLTAGLTAVRRDKVVVAALAVFALSNLAATAPIALGIPLRGAQLGWSAAVYGFAYLGFATGYVIGSGLITPVLAKRVSNNLKVALVLLIPGTVGLGLLAIANNPWTTGLSCFVTGLFFAPAAALLRGEIRERTPHAMMGRVSSVVQLAIFGLIPVGHLLYGVVAAASTLTMAGLTMTALMVLAILGGSIAASRASRPHQAKSGSEPTR